MNAHPAMPSWSSGPPRRGNGIAALFVGDHGELAFDLSVAFPLERLDRIPCKSRERGARPQTGFGISPDDQVLSLEDGWLGDVISNPLSGCGYPPTVQAVTRYSGDDFYCDVAIPDPGQLDVVYEDELVLAFRHTRPFWDTHIVVVPKRHIASLTTLSSADEQVARRLLEVVRSIAAETERSTGAAAVLTNLGDYQDSKHLHIHVHSGSRRQPNS